MNQRGFIEGEGFNLNIPLNRLIIGFPVRKNSR